MNTRFSHSARISWLIAVAGIAAVSQYAEAAAGEPDPLIKGQLEILKVPYEVDEDGDFNITLELENGRTQLCFISSVVNRFESLHYREIYAYAHMDKGPLNARTAERALSDSASRLVGGWCLAERSSRESVLYYAAKVPAQMKPESLFEVVSIVAAVADEMEAELSGKKDEF